MAGAIQLVVLCALLLPCVDVSLAEVNGELIGTTTKRKFPHAICVCSYAGGSSSV